MAARRILKPDDMQSADDLQNERRQYTDEQARAIGYPNADVLRLSDELSRIAGEWRTTKASELVHEYHRTLYAMILKGYDVDTLPVQDQLPAELMPELPPRVVRQAIVDAYNHLDDE